MIKFYSYKKCSTCQKAEKALAATGKAFEVVDITTRPPSVAELKMFLQRGGYQLKDLLNTSGQTYRALRFGQRWPTMSEDEVLQALHQEGRLLKRPLVWDESVMTVGFKPESFAQAWQG